MFPNDSDAVKEYSDRIQMDGSERSRLAVRIGCIFAASSGGLPASEPGSTSTGTNLSRNTNPCDDDDGGGGGYERPNLTGYYGDDGGDEKNVQDDTFSSGSMDPEHRINEETHMLQVGKPAGSVSGIDQALTRYEPVAAQRKEQKIIIESELKEWGSYITQPKANITKRASNETITNV